MKKKFSAWVKKKGTVAAVLSIIVGAIMVLRFLKGDYLGTLASVSKSVVGLTGKVEETILKSAYYMGEGLVYDVSLYEPIKLVSSVVPVDNAVKVVSGVGVKVTSGVEVVSGVAVTAISGVTVVSIVEVTSGIAVISGVSVATGVFVKSGSFCCGSIFKVQPEKISTKTNNIIIDFFIKSRPFVLLLYYLGAILSSVKKYLALCKAFF